MKRQILKLVTGLLLASTSLSAQVVYLEDFDGVSGPTSGGAGTYNFAPGFLLRNVDNRTPNAAVAYVNDAWERREDFANNVADSCAFSTSWYTPVGAANDFMWTPLIGVLPANCVLSWNAVAYDAQYPDGYEVRIMTSSQGPPTGGNAVIGNQLTNSTQVFTIPAENSTWTSRTVNLGAYAGQSIYVGFRNSSNDQFLLLIDDIKVEVQTNYDARITFVDTLTEYTATPLLQVQPLPFTGTVNNNGLLSLSNVVVNVNIFNSANTSVYTATSAAISSLAPAANATFTIPAYTPTADDVYTTRFIVSHSQTDQNLLNDTVYDGFFISDTVYARDNGVVTGALGIGAGNGGYLGQAFQVVTADQLTSVSYYHTLGYTGEKHAAVIWSTLPNGSPNAIIASTDTLIYADDSARFYTNMLSNGPITLNPGWYVITAVEFDSTVQLGYTNDIHTANKTWVEWPTNPASGWSNAEDFGPQFAKAFVIRANFGDVCTNFAAATTATSATCGSCADGSATTTTTAGNAPFTYAWSPSGGNAATANALMMGAYIVTITDQFGCVVTDTVSVGNDCSSFLVQAAATSVASCGSCADGTAGSAVTNGVGPYTYVWSNGDTTAIADSLLPGIYTLTITDSTGCSLSDTVLINFSTAIDVLAATGVVDVYPNPSMGSFQVTLNFTAATEARVELYNALGENVFTQQVNATAHAIIPVTLENRAAGYYMLRVTTNEGVRIVPVVIN
ncbi:MAG: choice-of-anchor J domain-containing protein [Bacteroidia bacterium]